MRTGPWGWAAGRLPCPWRGFVVRNHCQPAAKRTLQRLPSSSVRPSALSSGCGRQNIAEFHQWLSRSEKFQRVGKCGHKNLAHARVRCIAGSDPEDLGRCTETLQKIHEIAIFRHYDGVGLARSPEYLRILRVTHRKIAVTVQPYGVRSRLR